MTRRRAVDHGIFRTERERELVRGRPGRDVADKEPCLRAGEHPPCHRLVVEPAELEAQFRALTRLRQSATKDWADSYLAAFATVGQLTLVTFDKGLRAKAKSTVLLG